MKKLVITFFVIANCCMAFSQNVGIGTTTPNSKLQVVDSGGNTRLEVFAPPVGAESTLELLAGNNPFSYLSIIKYSPGAVGTLFGIPKSNLSAINTGGNAGPLLLGTGDGMSPIIFGAGAGEQMRITSEGRVGIGTAIPAFANRLHVHSNDVTFGGDVSIGITNTFTTDASGRGARFRLNGSNLIISNNEASGNLQLSTNFNTRLTIDPAGKIGIGNLSPVHKLDIADSAATSGVNVRQAGAGPAIKAVSPTGSSQIGVELENNALKVSGVNRSVFQHVATAGNSLGNETAIPNTTLANSSTDLLIVTPVWEGVYVNSPIGIYFSGGTWRIFRQDLANMPLNAKFNVLVVKQ